MRGRLFGITFRFSARWDGGFIGVSWVRGTCQLNSPSVICTDHHMEGMGAAKVSAQNGFIYLRVSLGNCCFITFKAAEYLDAFT